jgi:hypothetical protein
VLAGTLAHSPHPSPHPQRAIAKKSKFVDSYFESKKFACPPGALGKSMLHYGRAHGRSYGIERLEPLERPDRSERGPRPDTIPKYPPRHSGLLRPSSASTSSPAAFASPLSPF